MVTLNKLGFRLLKARLAVAHALYGHCGPRNIRTDPKTLFKLGRRVHDSEAEAMQYIADNTSVPVPRVYCVYKYRRITSIKMDFVPGQLAFVWDEIQPAAQQAFLVEFQSYVRQIRSLISPTPASWVRRRQLLSRPSIPSRDQAYWAVLDSR
jgi:hypothetical protein